MARYQKDPNAPSAEDKALDRFADLMIEKIQSITEDWKKPWFTEGVLGAPRNFEGRKYNGGNSLMLMMEAESKGYQLPVWGTFNSIQTNLNKPDKNGKSNLEESVHVRKGEKSFPVFLTTFKVVSKDEKKSIPYDEYKGLPEDEKAKYNVYPKLQVYNVFNIDQTNLKELRPELYEKYKNECMPNINRVSGEKISFPALDEMVANKAWLCPVVPMVQDRAFYALESDRIVVPTKDQFVDGESYYGTMLHEMVHSTGHTERLNRLTKDGFGSTEYAKEELVAEMGAALVCQQYGIQKGVKEESASYLKHWLSQLKQSPTFVKDIMNDVKRSTGVIGKRIDAVQQDIEQGREVKPYTKEQAVKDFKFTHKLDEAATQTKKSSLDNAVAKDFAGYSQKGSLDLMSANSGEKATNLREVDVFGLMNALKINGEAKISDHFVDNNSSKSNAENASQEEEQKQTFGRRR